MLFILAHFGHHVLNALLVPLLPFIRNDFSLNYARSGAVVSAFILSYGIAQLPAGWLADRTDTRIMITVGVSGVAFAGLLVGLSQSFLFLIVFLILMGVLGGGYHPAAPPLIASVIKPANRGRALGMHLIGGSASHFLAPLIGVGIAAAIGWRATFISLSVPMILLGFLLFFVLRRMTGLHNTSDADGAEDASEDRAGGRRYAGLIAFIVMSTATASIFASVISFITLFFVDFHGLAEEKAGLYLALIYSAGLWAAPLGGYAADRLGARRVVAACGVLTAVTIAVIPLLSFSFVFIPLLLAGGALMFTRMPATEAYIIAGTGLQNRSTILGIYYFAGMEGSGIFTPLLGGLIDAYGFKTSFLLMAALLFILVLLTGIFSVYSKTPRSSPR